MFIVTLSSHSVTFDWQLADGTFFHDLQNDLKGINEAKNYWQAYFDKYTFEHAVLAGAVDKEDSAAFCFWLDRVSLTLHEQSLRSCF